MRTIVEESPPHSQLVTRRDRCLITVLAGVQAGALFRFDGDEMVIGRGEEAEIRLFDDGLSRAHARIFRLHGNFVIEDLGSTNGTYVGCTKITGPQPLADGARIGLGRRTILKLSMQDALEEAHAIRLYESTVRDGLTGAFNRRAFDDRLKAEFAFAARHGSGLSCIVFDVDHFKRLNDTYGHPAGDEVLRQLSSRVSHAIRTEDLLARYGGEEFVVLARGIDPAQAHQFADRLRSLIEHHPVTYGHEALWATASFGVATMNGRRRFASEASFFAAADAALYEAKRSGRNRVVTG